MSNTDLGKIGITVGGEFVANTDYEIQTIITYSGASYISIAQTGGALPTDTTKWLKLCENGTIGSMWYSGTSITGTSSTPTVFSESGIENANPQDMYLNTSYSYVYQCVLGGNSSVATWKYLMTLTGGHASAGLGEPGVTTPA